MERSLPPDHIFSPVPISCRLAAAQRQRHPWGGSGGEQVVAPRRQGQEPGRSPTYHGEKEMKGKGITHPASASSPTPSTSCPPPELAGRVRRNPATAVVREKDDMRLQMCLRRDMEAGMLMLLSSGAGDDGLLLHAEPNAAVTAGSRRRLTGLMRRFLSGVIEGEKGVTTRLPSLTGHE